jgi:GLPGLI family protein
MKYLFGLLLFCSIAATAQVKQKVLSDLTIHFSVNYTDSSRPQDLVPALMVVYIKGQLSRVDFSTTSYTQIRLHDAKKDSVFVLQHAGTTKLRRSYDSVGWERLNNRYDSLRIELTNETKKILGYDCRKAVISLKNGSTYYAYYATTIAPSTREYELPFRNIPGLVLEYETVAEGSNRRIRYNAIKINPSPVQASKFEIPKSGYRVL